MIAHNKTIINNHSENYRRDSPSNDQQFSSNDSTKCSSGSKLERIGGAEGYHFFWPFRREVSDSTALAMLSMRASRAASAADVVLGGVGRLFVRLSTGRSLLGERLRLLDVSR